MYDPKDEHIATLHRILLYVKNKLNYGLQLYKSSVSFLISYTDFDWGSCPDIRHSTSSYYVFVNNNLIS